MKGSQWEQETGRLIREMCPVLLLLEFVKLFISFGKTALIEKQRLKLIFFLRFLPSNKKKNTPNGVLKSSFSFSCLKDLANEQHSSDVSLTWPLKDHVTGREAMHLRKKVTRIETVVWVPDEEIIPWEEGWPSESRPPWRKVIPVCFGSQAPTTGHLLQTQHSVPNPFFF